jgi:nicotinamidase-related amidase
MFFQKTNRRVQMSSKLEVLTPQNSQVLFIDQQPQMAFGVQSIDRQVLKNNVVGLAKAAKVFDIPTTITTVKTESFSGHTYPELLTVFPDHPLLERTSMNSWDDLKVREALAANAAKGHKKIVVSGLWPRSVTTRSRSPASPTPITKFTWWPTRPAAPRSTRTNSPWTA